jgi:hypothetical protein
MHIAIPFELHWNCGEGKGLFLVRRFLNKPSGQGILILMGMKSNFDKFYRNYHR